MTEQPPAECLDWRGERWTELGRLAGKTAAHPNARFTAPASQCPIIDADWEAPEGVPISAIIFGGRRAHVAARLSVVQLELGCVRRRDDGFETTAAATGSVGALRRDPMAMLPFCGYHAGDYFRHWIKMQRLLSETPKIFHVNWFRKDAEGRFLWPGFRENMRVLKWIVDRVHGRVLAKETPIGWMARYEDIDWSGLDINREQFEELQKSTRAVAQEVIQHEELFIDLHDHLPPEMVYERELLICRL